MITTPEQLIAQVCATFGVTPQSLYAPSHKRQMADIRSVIVRTLRDDWHLSYDQIGKHIKRDHKDAIRLYRRSPSPSFRIPKNPVGQAMKIATELGKKKSRQLSPQR